MVDTGRQKEEMGMDAHSFAALAVRTWGVVPLCRDAERWAAGLSQSPRWATMVLPCPSASFLNAPFTVLLLPTTCPLSQREEGV